MTRQLWLGAVVMAVVTPALAAADEGMTALYRYVGSWSSSGTALQTPFSRAGSLSGQTTCRASGDGVFVVCEQVGHYGLRTGHDVTIFTYDRNAAKYRFYRITQGEASASPLAYDGRGTFTFSDQVKRNGVTTYFRTVNTFHGTDNYVWRTEYSADLRQWKLMNSGNVRRNSI